ncbi:bacillithiol biosynthesis cysteine-adding enzyme BshC [Cohnella lubricantis]|uniref:Putative cysteine ligase BshC n=1 Tax=Cohnella lubricantis TaxID=2163172 RepID=A0A841T8S3_9BACL|nr:bacillithiol biosynthesis cysteine-adding enzyme BshC [Cohnella lubricantis]MBB6677332.1 bacillithiol biosynthesis cysteine-adding enzyme BshC [Cohnella lubricantis]MBP2116856.1 bacillithiol biosynthesis cysteine-adding enzyme BshC [Cohnella lubricantis]
MNLTPLEGLSSPSLAERYRMADPAVCGLFGSHPSNSQDWLGRADWLDRTEANRADRSQLASVLRAYQTRIGTHEAAVRAIDSLERDQALAVVGGQQAGLFGGALLIVYKALTVIQTAKYAEELLGRPVVPVFWIAGEDHDFDEANHVHIGSIEGQVKRIRIERPEGARHAVSRTELSSEQWAAAVEELSAALPDSEFKPALLDRLREQVADAPTLTIAFARLLSDWFGSDGLVLLDADDPALRRLEGSFFRRLIERNDEVEAALAEGDSRVRSLGWPVQAESAPGCANLFVHGDAGRVLLYKQNGRFADRRGEVSFERDELLRLADENPDRLSNNALTRPLMQDFALPVLATVLGPSEIAYWGQLGPAFARLEIEMPLIVPRQSFTYLEPGVVKLLEKYEVSPLDIIRRGDELKAQWLERQDQWQLEAKFAAVRERFAELYAPILDTVAQVESGLAKLGEANRDRIMQQIAYLQERAEDSVAKKHDAGLRQWDRMRFSLWPQGKPQERIYGAIHFLNRYGPDWLELWKQAPYDVTGGHRIVSE